MANERYWLIHYGCGCGDNEDFIIAPTHEAALDVAYECAVSDYHSYEGYHGVMSEADVAEDMFGDLYGDCEEEFDLDSLTDEQWAEVADRYHDEIEMSIDYWVEEITYEQYVNESVEDYEEEEDEED